MSQDLILFVQTQLQKLGLYQGQIDGIFGQLTNSTISNFYNFPNNWSENQKIIGAIQILAKNNGIDSGEIDGIWGNKTQSAYNQLKTLFEPSKNKESSRIFTPEQINTLIEIERGELGVHEEGGNNKGKRIDEYQRASWLEEKDWGAWCATFQDWGIQQWQIKCPNLPKFNRPQTAGAFDYIRWAKEERLLVLPKYTKAKAGDLVVFYFSHIGLVEEDQDGEYFISLEGNTNESGTRDSNYGDGVFRKKRHQNLAKNLIRWEFV